MFAPRDYRLHEKYKNNFEYMYYICKGSLMRVANLHQHALENSGHLHLSPWIEDRSSLQLSPRFEGLQLAPWLELEGGSSNLQVAP